MEIGILEMGAAKMVKFNLDTNAQQQASLAYLLIQTSAETGLFKVILVSNATMEALSMEMAAGTSASLRIYGVAKSLLMIVNIRGRFNVAIISSKLVRTVTPQHLVSVVVHASLLSAAMGKETKLLNSATIPIPVFVTLTANFQPVEMAKSTQQMKTVMTLIVQSVIPIAHLLLYVEMEKLIQQLNNVITLTLLSATLIANSPPVVMAMLIQQMKFVMILTLQSATRSVNPLSVVMEKSTLILKIVTILIR